MSPRALLLCLVLFFLSTFGKAYSFPVASNKQLTLDLGGWAQGGLVATAANNNHNIETYLGMARVSALARYQNLGQAFVQLEALSGTAELLDVIGEVYPLEDLIFRAGYFRTPLSFDQLIGAPFTPFVNRGWVVQRGFAATRRTGTELEYTQSLGSMRLRTRVGLFGPTADERELLGQGELGQALSLNANLALTPGLEIHLSYYDQLLGKNQLGGPRNPGDPQRPIRFDQLLDVALSFKQEGWTLIAEALGIFDALESKTPFSAYVMLLKSFPFQSGKRAWEPGVRYDIARLANAIEHRFTLGLNLYLIGDFLNLSLNEEISHENNTWASTTFVQLQAGF